MIFTERGKSRKKQKNCENEIFYILVKMEEFLRKGKNTFLFEH